MADISNATYCIKVYDKCDKTNGRYFNPRCFLSATSKSSIIYVIGNDTSNFAQNYCFQTSAIMDKNTYVHHLLVNYCGLK